MLPISDSAADPRSGAHDRLMGRDGAQIVHPDHPDRLPWPGVVRVVAPIRPVQKSPLLIVAESWLSTVVSTIALAVSETI